MQDRQLYQQILGIERPWFVARVELDVTAEQVHVYLEHGVGETWPCPECGQPCGLRDHQPERRWRHLDTCQFETVIHAAPPRVDCPEHGARVVRLPWAELGSHFTMLFERLAVDWLRAASQTAVAKRLGLSWDEVHGIMARAVERGLKRRQADPICYLGVDEKSFRKGHRYATIVTDILGSRVLHVAEERTEESLNEFWPTLTATQKAEIEAVAMDMWDPYVRSTTKHLTDGAKKIVYDKFHVAKHLGEAVDQVRRKENKALLGQGDKRLVGTKYKWLRNPDNFKDATWRTFAQLRQSKLKTARAWALKEQAMVLWNYCRETPARKHFAWWYRWATHSRLAPMIRKAKMLRSRLPNILTYLKHPITNATSESLNAKIQWAKYTARGFRNFDNFKMAIYFHCGGLDLSPQPT